MTLVESCGDGRIALEDRVPQHLVRYFAQLAFAQADRVDQGLPAGETVLARERMLHGA